MIWMICSVTALSIIAHSTGMGFLLKEELIETAFGQWLLAHMPHSWVERGKPLTEGGTGQIFVIPFLSHIGSCLTCTTFWLNAAAYTVWGYYNGYAWVDTSIITGVVLAVHIGEKLSFRLRF